MFCLFAASKPPRYYVGLNLGTKVNAVTTLVKFILANMTGTATSFNETQCQNPKDVPGESKDVCNHPVYFPPPDSMSLNVVIKCHWVMERGLSK